MKKCSYLLMFLFLFSKNIFGAGENFNGQTTADFGTDFMEKDLSNSTWVGADASGADFRRDADITNLSNADFTDAILSRALFWGADLSGANFTRATLSGTDFFDAYIGNAIFTDAIITGASFNNTSITVEQIYSTLSYKNKDLLGIQVNRTNLYGAKFASQNLSYADFNDANLGGADLTNANLTGAMLYYTDLSWADLRGAKMGEVQYDEYDTPVYLNTIMADGVIKNFSVASGNNFVIHAYIPLEGGSMISAKIDTTSTISGGATLTLEQGADLEILSNKVLTFASDANLVIDTDINSGTDFIVNENAGVTFEKGATLTINLTLAEDFSLEEEATFSVMKWAETSTIAGADAFEKNKDIFLNVNGESFSGNWNYFIENNQLSISLISVPEPAEWTVIFGAVALGFVMYRRRK